MQILVGLGNPGSRYAGHRHNVGFMAIDRIAERHGIGPFRKKFNAEIADGHIAGTRVLLVKPQTFMNRSGLAVGEAARFHKLGAGAITVFHDELDLPPGKVRVKRGGGHGGHNGLRDIDPVIGKDYQRVRIGIGHPGHKDRVHGHVLSDFAKADADWLDPLLDAMADAISLLLSGGPDKFMTRIAPTPPSTPAQRPPVDGPRRAVAEAPAPAEPGTPSNAPAWKRALGALTGRRTP